MTKKSKHQTITLDELISQLKANDLKLTPPRKLILGTLLKHHGPFSAEDLHKQFGKNTCDLVTIYRNLSHLEEIKMVRRCEFGDGVARYELAHPDDDHHHHIICKDCRKVVVLNSCEMDLSLNHYAKKQGFKGVSHILEFFGTCPDCQ
jgi:Fur family ferric uptake transcriptional regulator